MRENPYDRISNRTLEIVEKVSDRIAQIFKGTNPYDQSPMTKEEFMMRFNQMPLEERMQMLERLQGGKK